ncbi:MAG: hypothetical protein ACYCZF_00410 [Anaerolineae bacterium]
MNPYDLALGRAAEIRRSVYAGRPLPLTDLSYTRTLNVTDYGIKPNSGEDALPAIRRVLALAQVIGSGVRICFAPGRYDLYPEFTGAGHCLTVTNAVEMTLDGGLAELVIHNPLAGFVKLVNCKRMIVRDFEVDYDPLPFTQGIVQDVHPADGAFNLLIDPGFSTFDDPHWQLLEPNMNWMDCASWGMLKDRTIPGRLKRNCNNVYFYQRFERLCDRLYRLHLTPPDSIKYVEPGDRYVHLSRPESWDGTFVGMQNCDGVTFINMLNYCSPSWCYTGWGSSSLSFINCQVRLKPGRWHTLDSDGINTAGGRIGPWIENCLFEGGADDTFVSQAATLGIQRVVDDHTLQLGYLDYFKAVQVGDPVLFYNPRDGLPLGKGTVEAIDYTVNQVRFSEVLPAFYQSDIPSLQGRVLDLACANNNFVMRGNTVRNVRRWPIWLCTPVMCGGIIEHNHLEGVDGALINMFSDVGWSVPRDLIAEYAARPDGVLPAEANQDYGIGHVLIAHNTLADCAFSSRQAAISSMHPRLGYKPSPWPMLEEMVILENDIHNWCGEYALSLSNMRRALVYGNTIHNDPGLDRGKPAGYVYSSHCEGMTLEANTLSDPVDLPVVVEGLGCRGIKAL